MLLTLVSILAFTASTFAAKTPDLTKLLDGNKNLTSISTLIQKYGDIYATLSFENNITILAPSDDAFNKLPYSSLGTAFETNDTGIIRSILQYHVLNGTYASASFNSSFQFIPTHLTNSTYSNVTGGAVVSLVKQAGDVIIAVSGEGSRSTVTTNDLQFTGGLVQVIDTFLVPPENFLHTAPTFNLTAFGGATTKAKLNDYLDTTDDITVFAPWNDAFQGVGSALQDVSVEELGNILDYHIVNGTAGYSSVLTNGTVLKSRQGGNLTVRFADNSLYINSAKIVQQDLLLSNGVLHVLDNVLDYNATGVFPNPVIPTQPPIILGSSVSFVPFTTDFPKTVSSFSTSSPTGAAASSTFGVSDIGSAATTTDSGAAASSTDYSATSTGKKKKNGAVMARGDPSILAMAIGGAALVLAF